MDATFALTAGLAGILIGVALITLAELTIAAFAPKMKPARAHTRRVDKR